MNNMASAMSMAKNMGVGIFMSKKKKNLKSHVKFDMKFDMKLAKMTYLIIRFEKKA